MILSESPKIQAFNIDCMDFMRDKPDNYYELAIVDPPYGKGCNLEGGSSKTGTNGWSGLMLKASDWNNIPDVQYFDELRRVSSNQIVWGGNYFVEYLSNSQGWIVWDKGQRDFTLADGELAWTSFNKALRIYEYSRGRANSEKKTHPTQKPVALYRWLIKNYAKEGDKILDTHGGSFSSAIACHMEGFDLDICELDEDYFNDAVKRFKLNTVQEKLF